VKVWTTANDLAKPPEVAQRPCGEVGATSWQRRRRDVLVKQAVRALTLLSNEKVLLVSSFLFL
jgi:hypothetical protein